MLNSMVNKSASRDALTSTRSNIVRNVSMPIYLYVKTHNQTGLKYLGKTTATDPHAYPGSGLYWTDHLRTHGSNYLTEILLETEDSEEIRTVGRYYSALWNVVESDEWANLQPEEGQGFASGKHHHSKRPGYINPAKQEENRQRASERMKALGDKHISKTEEFKTNMSGDRNPAHLPHVKERMTENNPMYNPEIVKKLSGENNAGYDHKIYKWKNIKTGQVVSMTRHELYTKYNLRKEHVGRVAQKQKGFKSVQGWSLDE
jgi:hypothetical protein